MNIWCILSTCMAGILNLLDNLDNIPGQRRPRHVRERVDPLQIYDDIDLVARYRFRREDITMINDLIYNDIKHATDKNHALSPSMQLLIALRFYASGSMQRVVGDTFHVSPSTVCQVIRRVSLALAEKLNEYVFIPQNRAYIQSTKEKFADIANFHGVIACVDGTQIPIQAPSVNEHEYVNRKGVHAINIQIMADADRRIVNTVIRYPGSTHDARILRNSAIFRDFENGVYNGLVLGDSAYPLLTWLMKIFLAPATDEQRRFNNSLSSTRQTVECSIGKYKT